MNSSRTLTQTAALLRAGRESTGMDIEQVSLATHIPAAQIAALEVGDLSGLPGAPYARAFARTLALAYGLDPDEIQEALRQDMGLPPAAPSALFNAVHKESPAVSEPRKQGGSKGPLWLIGILVVALIALLVGTRLQSPPEIVPVAQDTAHIGSPEDLQDPGAPAPDSSLPLTPAPIPTVRTLTVQLVDTSKTAFLLYARAERIRKRTFVSQDTLTFDPDTAAFFRNLSGQALRISGALQRDTVSLKYFRLVRENDSVKFVEASASEWETEYARIMEQRNRNESNSKPKNPR